MSKSSVQADKIRLIVIRDARNPSVIDVSDVRPSVLDDRVIVFGSQSSSGDFNPYCFIYKDFLQKIHVCKFTQTEAINVFFGLSEEESITKALAMCEINMHS